MLEASIPTDIAAMLTNINPNIDVNTGTIFELKKAETSLEDAFIKLVDKTTENKVKVESKKESKEKDKITKKANKKEDKKGGEK